MVDITIPAFDSDDRRAVSPVIGVILMVAITVILAAVIGAFVLNLGSDLQQTAPQASIGVEDAPTALSGDEDQNVLLINHQQGDPIEFGNLRIVVQLNGVTEAKLDAGNNWANEGFTIQDAGSIDNSTEFSAGDQIVLTESGDSADPGQYTIRIIAIESGSTVATRTVQVE